MIELNSRINADLHIIDVSGNLDLEGSIALKEMIQKVRQSGAMKILLNFKETVSVQSQFLQNLVTPIKALITIKGKVGICGMTDTVHKVIQTAMFYQIVEVFNTEEDALVKFK